MYALKCAPKELWKSWGYGKIPSEELGESFPPEISDFWKSRIFTEETFHPLERVAENLWQRRNLSEGDRREIVVGLRLAFILCGNDAMCGRMNDQVRKSMKIWVRAIENHESLNTETNEEVANCISRQPTSSNSSRKSTNTNSVQI